MGELSAAAGNRDKFHDSFSGIGTAFRLQYGPALSLAQRHFVAKWFVVDKGVKAGPFSDDDSSNI